MTPRFLLAHLGLYGDLAMGTVAARALKAAYPDCHVTYAVGGDFRDFAPLLINHPHIDRIYVTHSPRDRYDETDVAWIKAQRFDHVFNPMQDHNHAAPWHLARHQTHETCFMHGIPVPAGDTGKIELVRWFEPKAGVKDHVAFAPFAGWQEGIKNVKALDRARAQTIADGIRKLGFSVLQVGHPDEPSLVQYDDEYHPDTPRITRLSTPYFESVRHILGCRAMVMGDSGLAWVLSGYDFPLVGLYGNWYHGDRVSAIQPVNPNARYLVARTINEIPVESVVEAVRNLLDKPGQAGQAGQTT